MTARTTMLMSRDTTGLYGHQTFAAAQGADQQAENEDPDKCGSNHEPILDQFPVYATAIVVLSEFSQASMLFSR